MLFELMPNMLGHRLLPLMRRCAECWSAAGSVVEGAACFQVGGGERDIINPKQVRHEGSPVMIRQHRPDIDAAPDAASSLRLIGEASRVLGEPGKTGYPG
jgi:hypothetical protein